MTYRDTQEAHRDALQMERNSILADDEPEPHKIHPYERELERVKDDLKALRKFATTMMREAIDMNDLVRDLSHLLANSMSNCDALRAANAELRDALNEMVREDLK